MHLKDCSRGPTARIGVLCSAPYLLIILKSDFKRTGTFPMQLTCGNVKMAVNRGKKPQNMLMKKTSPTCARRAWHGTDPLRFSKSTFGVPRQVKPLNIG